MDSVNYAWGDQSVNDVRSSYLNSQFIKGLQKQYKSRETGKLSHIVCINLILLLKITCL